MREHMRRSGVHTNRPSQTFMSLYSRGRRIIPLACLVAIICLAVRTSCAQSALPEQKAEAPTEPEQIEPTALPALAQPVLDLLEQDYLTDQERRDITMRHGAWPPDEKPPADATPAQLAAAALMLGDLLHPALNPTDPAQLDATLAPLTADALIRTGHPARALTLLADRTDARSIGLRARAMLELGRTDDAAATLTELADRLKAAPINDANELTEAVRGVLALARIKGATGPGVIGYQDMLGMIARARDELDRLSWNALLCESQLLYEKDRYEDAIAALSASLELNPRQAEAWAILGNILVDGFDFPRAESAAARLDLLARELRADAPPSIDAAVIRARIRLRQGEGEQADAQLAPALAIYPESRLLLAWHAAAAAAQFNDEVATRRLAAFDALAPNTPDAYLAAGRTMASARQYDEAARYLTIACERAPHWAEPAIELGLSELQAGRLSVSRAALDKAATMDRYNIRAENSLKLLKELETYSNIESDHFIVRYKPGIDETLAREMLDPLEAIFTRVTGNQSGGIDHAPAAKTVVELYPNHRWFATRITGMPQLHTIAAATGPVIAMEAPREGPGHHGAYDWRRVVQHEYTHTVTLSRTKNRLPHWFTEAAAVYLEDAPRDYRTIQLIEGAYRNDMLFDLDSINIGFVRPKRPTDRQLAYAQGHWMYEFIIAHAGPSAPLKLMDLYATGVREEAAFTQVIGLSRADFLKAFRQYAGEQLSTWGVRATDTTPDIQMLLEREAARLRDAGDTSAAPDEPTSELLHAWLEANPENPFVLEASLRDSLKASNGALTPDLAPLAERYAVARPVDPWPHKLLAQLRLKSATPADAIPNLEYLDAREQSTNSFAMELARLYAASGDLPAARLKAIRVTQLSPYDARAREFAAAIFVRAADLDRAQQSIEALVALEPDRDVHKQRLEAIRKRRESQPAR